MVIEYSLPKHPLCRKRIPITTNKKRLRGKILLKSEGFRLSNAKRLRLLSKLTDGDVNEILKCLVNRAYGSRGQQGEAKLLKWWVEE